MGGNVLIQGKLVTDRTVPIEIRVDSSGSLIAITHEHSKVHQGQFYTTGYYNAAVASGSSIDVLVQTGTKSVHTYIICAVGGNSTFSIYEGTTFSAAGTSLTPMNNNRSSSNTPLATFTHTPTITLTGTQLDGVEFIPGGSSAVATGAIAPIGSEQITMAPSTNYLFRLTNISGVATELNTRISFYEV